MVDKHMGWNLSACVGLKVEDPANEKTQRANPARSPPLVQINYTLPPFLILPPPSCGDGGRVLKQISNSSISTGVTKRYNYATV